MARPGTAVDITHAVGLTPWRSGDESLLTAVLQMPHTMRRAGGSFVEAQLGMYACCSISSHVPQTASTISHRA